MRKSGLAVAVLAMLVAARPVAADPITVGFTWTVRSAVNADHVFGIPLGSGQSFQGTLVYEPAQPVGAGSISLDAGSGVHVPLTEIFVWDDYPCGVPEVCDALDAYSFPSVPGFDAFQVALSLRAPATSHTGSAPPASAAEFVLAFQRGGFWVLANRTGEVPPWDSHVTEIFGTVEMYDVAATPEPGSLLLLGTGMLGLARAARRRRPGAVN